jgi:hypothetical protein
VVEADLAWRNFAKVDFHGSSAFIRLDKNAVAKVGLSCLCAKPTRIQNAFSLQTVIIFFDEKFCSK